jgi:membrane protein YqaA with SNARE-associated domain
MKLWLRIIIVFVVQEVVLMNTTLLQAHQLGYSVIVMTLIFLAASIFDVFVGYKLGTWLQKRFAERKIVAHFKHQVQSLEQLLGSRGYRLVLTMLGFVNFNYVNAFLASWTQLPFKTIATYLVLGDMLWYCTASVVIRGITTFVNPFYAIYVVMGISIGFLILSSVLHRRFLKSHLHYKSM